MLLNACTGCLPSHALAVSLSHGHMPGCVSLCTHLRTCGQTLEVAAGLSLPPCLHSLYQALPVCCRAMRPRRLHCWRLVWPTWWLQGCTPAISSAQMCTSCWEAPGVCLREVQTLLLGKERWRGGGWQCTHCCWGTSSNRLCRRVSIAHWQIHSFSKTSRVSQRPTPQGNAAAGAP